MRLGIPSIAFSVWDTRKFGCKPRTASMASLSSTEAETFASRRTVTVSSSSLVST